MIGINKKKCMALLVAISYWLVLNYI